MSCAAFSGRHPRTATLPALAITLVAALCPAQPPVGWRTDGTGRYPDAVLPAGFPSNVLWTVELDEKGRGPDNAAPLVVRNRVIVALEPDTLLCLNADTGDVLWRHSATHEDVYPAEQLAARRAETEAAFQAANAERLRRQGEQGRAQKALQESPDDDALKAKLDTAKQEFVKARDAMNAARAAAAVYNPKYVQTSTHTGLATCSPVSDGDRVWMLFGTGIIECRDLNGNRQWVRMTEVRDHTWGQAVSPVLVGNKLILSINDLFALDKHSGKELWRTAAQTSKLAYHGSLLATRIGSTDIVITPDGDFVRADDGFKLATKAFSPIQCTTPVLHDGMLYSMGDAVARAFALPAALDGDTLAIEKVWQSKTSPGQTMGSPLYHEGLLYGLEPKGMLNVLDASTGELVYEHKWDGFGTEWASLSLVGNAVVAVSRGGSGLVAALKPGREFVELARGHIDKDSFTAGPVATGTRLYLRGFRNLYCIGR